MTDRSKRAGENPTSVRRWIVGVVAVPILVAAVAPVVTWVLNRPSDPPSPLPKPEVYTTLHGQWRDVTLKDGTRVVLGPDSTLEARFGKIRSVRLRGEAIFTVAYDGRRPFTVCANGSLFSDLSTSFDVLAQNSSVATVTVREGEVGWLGECGTTGESISPPRRSWFPWNQDDLPLPRITLGTLEQMTIATSDKGSPRTRTLTAEQVNDVMGWPSGKLFFDNVPLTEALDTVNRYFPTHFQIADQRLAGTRVQGMYRSDNAGAFLRALKEMDGIVAAPRDPANPGVTKLVKDGVDDSDAPRGSQPH